MVRRSSTPKRSTRSCCSAAGERGFTLTELMVGMAVALVVTGATLSLAMSTRGLYEADQSRTKLNQSLRAARDFLATDIQHAGERLGNTFPVLEIVNGASGAPDELIVRRNLLDTVLSVCWNVQGGQMWIIVGIDPTFPTPPTPGCFKMPGAENVLAWQNHRTTHGADDDGSATAVDLRAYIYNPTTGSGQFFDYTGEWMTPMFHMIFAAPGTVWQNPYPLAEKPQLYILEERRYALAGDTLQFVRNGMADPLNIVDGIDSLQLRALFKPDPPNATPSPMTTFGFGDNWSMLRSIEISVEGSVDHRDKSVAGAFATEIMPRNVISK